MKRFFVLTGIMTTLALAATPVKLPELPMETAVYKPSAGVLLANGQCLTCHSADYISTQPPKGRDFWKAEVEKMKAKYGAPIPDAQIVPLIDYFAHNYGTDTGAPAATNVNLSAGPGGKIDAATLAKNAGCLGCHSVEAKIVGPAYKDVAAKYKGRADALERVEHQIKFGGIGQWGGPVMMPPFPQFTPEEVDALAHWVLDQDK